MRSLSKSGCSCFSRSLSAQNGRPFLFGNSSCDFLSWRDRCKCNRASSSFGIGISALDALDFTPAIFRVALSTDCRIRMRRRSKSTSDTRRASCDGHPRGWMRPFRYARGPGLDCAEECGRSRKIPYLLVWKRRKLWKPCGYHTLSRRVRTQRLCRAEASARNNHQAARDLANAATQRRAGAVVALPTLRDAASSRIICPR